MTARWSVLLVIYLLAISASYGSAQGIQQSAVGRETQSQAQLKLILEAAEASRLKLETAIGGTFEPVLNKPLFPNHSVSQMIFAAHVYQISSHDRTLLSTLPRNATEMEAFYEFTHKKGNERFLPYYRIFYKGAFELVGNNLDFTAALFDVATQFDTTIWPNYDDVDFFCSELRELRKKFPTQYDGAVRSRNRRDRLFLSNCGR
jgi:hypothetical protein